MVVYEKTEALRLLDATYAKDIPVLEPRTRCIGDAFNGAIPVATCEH